MSQKRKGGKGDVRRNKKNEQAFKSGKGETAFLAAKARKWAKKKNGGKEVWEETRKMNEPLTQEDEREAGRPMGRYYRP